MKITVSACYLGVAIQFKKIIGIESSRKRVHIWQRWSMKNKNSDNLLCLPQHGPKMARIHVIHHSLHDLSHRITLSFVKKYQPSTLTTSIINHNNQLREAYLIIHEPEEDILNACSPKSTHFRRRTNFVRYL